MENSVFSPNGRPKSWTPDGRPPSPDTGKASAFKRGKVGGGEPCGKAVPVQTAPFRRQRKAVHIGTGDFVKRGTKRSAARIVRKNRGKPCPRRHKRTGRTGGPVAFKGGLKQSRKRACQRMFRYTGKYRESRKLRPY
jgi:hypothetical protein